jgi:hypothetical protein
MWILVSASTTRVFVAFSMVNFVLPFCRLLTLRVLVWQLTGYHARRV